MAGSVLRSERFVVCAAGQEGHHKIFQVQFGRRDGSLFAHFPYFPHTTGIVSLVDLPASSSPSTEIRLSAGGKIASQLVKYSHHPDGHAHFSQDGRIVTAIRKQSVPLGDLEGHLFTLYVKGVQDFDAASEADKAASPSPKRQVVGFEFDGPWPDSLKFVGMLHSAAWLQRNAHPGSLVLPQMNYAGHPSFVCSPPMGTDWQDMCLVLSCRPTDWRKPKKDPLLLFLGGFDEESTMEDLAKPVSLLAMSYPVSNAEELRALLGSLDYTKESADHS